MKHERHRRADAASGKPAASNPLSFEGDSRRGGCGDEQTVTIAVPETLNSAVKVVAVRRGIKFARTLTAALLRADPDVAAAEKEIQQSRMAPEGAR